MTIKALVCASLLLASNPYSYGQAPRKAAAVHPAGEWPAYGNDAGGMRYSPLNQVNDKNVASLKVAWTYQTGELGLYEGTEAMKKAAFEATPIMIGRTLYFSTPAARVFAVDAATGKEQWVYDPAINLHTGYSEVTSRGVSAWPAGGSDKGKGASRIFVATIDGRLIALDAKTGKPISSFGDRGTVDLNKGMGGTISVTSPPAIIGNTIIVGSAMGDNQRFDYPPGTVRAYDVITGALKWGWDPIPRDSTNKAWYTWNGPKAHKTGAANAWATLSVDAARDMVFVPTSSPSPDYYGGERLGQNLYGNSIVALRASTGKLVWYYQVVHHDLWDYDIAAQPVLTDIMKAGKKVPAVIVGTKMGHIFILDRTTGIPLFPVEERRVPASDIPGEEAWPTQPFPVLPAPLGIQSVGEKDAWGPTEEAKEGAKKRIAQLRNKGIFTPPSYEGSVMTPGNAGGIHWGGMCVDPKERLLITNINILPAIIRMVPRERQAELEGKGSAVVRGEMGMQRGTPYVMNRDYLFQVDEKGVMMQTTPPWGTLVAIDLNSGLKKWEVPLGYMLDPQKYPGAEKWGSLNFGGAIVTSGNLIFVAASRDGHLRAFDSHTGAELWKYLLPAGGQATPMTYELDGKQYIVMAAGGHGKFSTKMGDYVVAFALEKP
ncbi:pyrroloquinoline quinone-dependent dehydrogenase [Paraflavitalea soli]|uniref:Pyrroloquinoline quinone-dependent dehydrogenase n=1 Tax=Paraflavitalea soli TaxID=2315862 RepID=A0A3B7MX66_9BACT|nr:pyrroloquinoline quinone-dependent dehydrogenase [Paraflavitalea soli]AXY77606.1 pyrroloquinoline quinone-dependent dehydrogenase [Paraflavitalea soli]